MRKNPTQPAPLYRGRLGRVNFEQASPVFPRCAHIASGILAPVSKADYRGQENLPQTGPAIIAPNHICNLDPLIVGHFLAYAGRWPHFLARANLFDIAGLGSILHALEQIPVERGTRSATSALEQTGRTIEAGKIAIVYPEGTFTYDPDEWPMAGHTGAARLALRTGAPVIPVGQWGANFIIPPRHKRKPKLIGRTHVIVQAGPAVDLADLMERGEHDRLAVREATVRILNAVTEQVGKVRGIAAPELRWHPGRKARINPAEAVL